MRKQGKNQKLEKMISRVSGVSFITITLLIVAGSGFFTDSSLFVEDWIVEWLQVVLLVVAGVLSLVSFFKLRTLQGIWKFVPLLFGLFCIWVALEEISYGQRIFGFESPYWFLRHNVHREVNIHNLLPLDHTSEVAIMSLHILWGLVFPITALALPKVENFARERFIPLPGAVTLTGCGLGLGLELYARAYCPGYWPMSNEILETYLYLAFLMSAFRIYTGMGSVLPEKKDPEWES